MMEFHLSTEKGHVSGVILETEGTFFTTKVKKGTPDLTSPYVHDLFAIVLIKQTFGKK